MLFGENYTMPLDINKTTLKVEGKITLDKMVSCKEQKYSEKIYCWSKMLAALHIYIV